MIARWRIGTGLFVATGSVILCPGVSYILYTNWYYALFLIINRRISNFHPVSFFSSYSTRFVDSSLGFTMGWLYWVCGHLSSVDIIVASNVLQYWDVFKVLNPIHMELNFLNSVVFN